MKERLGGGGGGGGGGGEGEDQKFSKYIVLLIK